MADTSSTARTPYAPEEPKASLVSNILAIIGFIILIVVVIWGLVHLASLSRGWFSSLFGSGNSSIEVSAPESATSGSPFEVSWKYDEPTEGSYSFLYPCEDGLQFHTPGNAGMNGIPCGAALALTSEEKTISVTPLLSRSEALAVPISIIFTPAATGTEAQGSASVTVTPGAVAPAPTPAPTPSTGSGQATPKPTPTPTPSPSKYSSPADLQVILTSAYIDASGQGVATFVISNIGGSSSGTYYFTAELPTLTGYAYSSPAQVSLAPGSRISNTLRFSGARSGVVKVSITTPDMNGANNYASQVVNAPYYDYDYQYNAPYQTYQQAPYIYAYPNFQQQPYYEQYPYSTYYPYTY